jgi:hypothetical protein
MRFGSFPFCADFILPLSQNPFSSGGQGEAEHFGVYIASPVGAKAT